MQELGKAEKVVDKMMSFKERTFECLVIYARGKIFLRENRCSVSIRTALNVWQVVFRLLTKTVVWSLCRFSDALEQFLFSLQILNNKILPGKLTWPLTKEIVKETLPEYFKVHFYFLFTYLKFHMDIFFFLHPVLILLLLPLLPECFRRLYRNV